MSRARSLAKIAGVALIAALTFAACTPPGSSPEPGASPTDASSSTQAGGDLRYHLYQAPTTFSPFHATNGADGEIAGLHFRPLMVTQGEDYHGILAKEWEVSDDLTTFTFTLQETNWSDGTPFTSADVLYTFETFAAPATASGFSGRLGGVKGLTDFQEGKADTITGLTAPDDHTVVIELDAPNVGFMTGLGTLIIVPKHIYGDIAIDQLQTTPEFREPTVGIGPYIFSRWVTDDQIEFVPNEESFEDHPLDHIYAQYLAGDVARAQLETGEIDIAQIAAADVDAAKAAGINVQAKEGIGVMSLFSALDSGKLADVKVRQAIMYAIDRQSIVDNVLGGNAKIAETLLYQPSWTIPNDLTEYNYDPDKAKALLAEANWDESVEVNLDIVPGQADRDAVMEIIAGQLQAVGINAKLHQVQPAELTTLVEDRKFDLLITILSMSPVEPALANGRFMCGQSLNLAAYCNEELDQLLKEASESADQAVREPLYHDAQRIINRDVPAIPLYVSNQMWGSTDRVQGFDPTIGALTSAQNWTVS